MSLAVIDGLDDVCWIERAPSWAIGWIVVIIQVNDIDAQRKKSDGDIATKDVTSTSPSSLI
jgi:hypothetical protein